MITNSHKIDLNVTRKDTCLYIFFVIFFFGFSWALYFLKTLVLLIEFKMCGLKGAP